MSLKHMLEWGGACAAITALRGRSWRHALDMGASLGATLGALGIRRAVARENLAIAFPERSLDAREAILAEHYRELGRVASEYARLGDLGSAPVCEAVSGMDGMENLAQVKATGRGAIVMSGHYSNFELMAARVGREFPMDLVVRPQKNPHVNAWLLEQRRRAGFGLISADTGVRGVFQALRAGHFVAMLADQDARRHGAFVPFFGRLASTALGPARIALQMDVPIVPGAVYREPDGRLRITIYPPLALERHDDEDAALRLTRLHTAWVEARIREHPPMWLWLHRRWKTLPPGGPTGNA